MRQWRVGTISMGIMLIGIGVLLLVEKVNGIASINLIIKWWPLILVLLGVEILGFVYFSKEESPKIKYDGFSIFMVIVIIIFSAGAYIITSFPLGNGRFVISNGYIGTYKYDSNYTKKKAIEAKESKKLDIINSYGNIEVERSDSSKVEVTAEIAIRNNDETYSKSISDKIVEVSQGDTIKVEAKAKSIDYDKYKIQSINIDFKIKVPANLEVNIKNEYGDITAYNVGKSLDISDKNGKIEVSSVGGDLTIENQYGDIESSGIKGKCEITDKNGQVDLQDVDKDVRIDNAFGNISLQNIGGSAVIVNNNADIKGTLIGGSVDIDSSYCGIVLESIKGGVKLKDKNGNVDIMDVGGNVKAENKYGDIKLDNVSKAIEVSDKNANIELNSDKIPTGDIKIENEYGNIDLSMPENINASIDAFLRYGDISNNYGFNVTEKNNEKSMNGTVGKGGVKIDIKNKNGNIDFN